MFISLSEQAKDFFCKMLVSLTNNLSLIFVFIRYLIVIFAIDMLCKFKSILARSQESEEQIQTRQIFDAVRHVAQRALYKNRCPD